MFELYDFTFSHYSEKARWALDFKGVPYTPRHLLPGFHMRTTRKLAPRSSVPILKTDSTVIQGSTEIINFLDQTFPDRSLTPPDPHDAATAIEWEKYLLMNINAETASNAEQRFALALDRLDHALERGPFLVGNRFSRAHLTACSLLWPLCRPGESGSEIEALLCPTVCALRKQLQHRRFYRWVLERYKEDRTPRDAR
jgi:glutathione S-transferase